MLYNAAWQANLKYCGRGKSFREIYQVVCALTNMPVSQLLCYFGKLILCKPRSNAPSETMADSSSHICAHFKHSDCNHINYTTFAKVSKVGQIVTNSYDTSLQNSRYVLEEWQNLAILIRLWIISICYAPEWTLERHNTQSLQAR